MDHFSESKICVMGAGAVGKLVAASLLMAGVDVTLLVRRKEQASYIRKNGLVLIRENGSQLIRQVPGTTHFFRQVPGTTQLVILTVKSYDTENAAKQIAKMPEMPKVFSLQNGLGNGEILASILGQDRIWQGITTYGATSLSDNQVAAGGEGELVLGGSPFYDFPFSGLNMLSDLFAKAGWKVRVAPDIQKEIWKKALLNIGINPVTAINRVTNGEIPKRSELLKTAISAIGEAGDIAIALSILSPNDVEECISRMIGVCQRTAKNRSSMLQDLDKGRQTEIDSLNGMIVRYGEQLNLDTPVNRRLTSQIKSLTLL